MSGYSRRFEDRGGLRVHESRGRQGDDKVRSRKTKWSGTAKTSASFGKNILDTIIKGHLTYEQIEAYQQYFRIEEISHALRVAQEKQVEVTSLLPSGDKRNTNYERDPSPPPIYDSSGNRTNTRENRVMSDMEKERHYLVEVAVRNIKGYVSPVDYRKPVKTLEKLYIPIKQYPDINFVGLLLGPRGNTLRQLQEDSGAKLAIRGKGSVKDGKSMSMTDGRNGLGGSDNSAEEDLHVVITADSHQKMVKAIKLTNEVIEKAINSPVGQNDLKRDQLRELAILNGTLRETKPFNPEANVRKPKPGIDVSQIVCNACGKIGHFARDCKSRAQQFSDGQGYNGFENRGPVLVERKRPHNEDLVQNVEEDRLPPWKKARSHTPLPPWKRPNGDQDGVSKANLESSFEVQPQVGLEPSRDSVMLPPSERQADTAILKPPAPPPPILDATRHKPPAPPAPPGPSSDAMRHKPPAPPAPPGPSSGASKPKPPAPPAPPAEAPNLSKSKPPAPPSSENALRKPSAQQSSSSSPKPPPPNLNAPKPPAPHILPKAS